jgi:3-hydroxybutyryl-CoA dehydrogenase
MDASPIDSQRIKTVGIVGAGQMGSGIAQVCAMAGLTVCLVDVTENALQLGIKRIGTNLARLVDKGLLSSERQVDASARISLHTEYDALSGCDLVIEAATENTQLKLRILRDIEQRLGNSSLIATNTSSISITQLGAVLDHPGRVIGMHFFNPVPVMNLVEIIPGLQTTNATLLAIQDLARAIGKTPITVRNSPGFVVNRILCPMLNEAIFVLGEGLATAEEIDAGMKLGCNHPVGPLSLSDMVGLDTLLSVLQVFYEHFNDSKYRPAPLLKELVAAGRLGRKTGQGFFSYQ